MTHPQTGRWIPIEDNHDYGEEYLYLSKDGMPYSYEEYIGNDQSYFTHVMIPPTLEQQNEREKKIMEMMADMMSIQGSSKCDNEIGSRIQTLIHSLNQL